MGSKLLWLLLLIGSLAVWTGCETAEGVGDDLEEVGEEIEEEVDDIVD